MCRCHRHMSDLRFADNVIGLKLSRIYSVEDRNVVSDKCPYKGLATFEESDSANFFGRERLVGELASRTVQVGLLRRRGRLREWEVVGTCGRIAAVAEGRLVAGERALGRADSHETG